MIVSPLLPLTLTILLTVVSLGMAGLPTVPEDVATKQRQPNFFDTPKVCRGWYCYEDTQTPDHEPQNLPESRDTAPPPFTGEVDWDAVWIMPPEAMKTLINDALSYAQQDPGDESRMVTYLKLQGVAMRRAKSFQEAWAETLLKYPLLDETVARAPTLAATNLEVFTERQERTEAIAAMRENMGLVYFYSPDCPYCDKEKDILASFLQKWNWQNFTAIDITANPGVAAAFDVQVVPDIWVVGNQDGEVLQRRLKAGLAEYADLERGLLKAWKLWFAGERYERPVMTGQIAGFSEFINKNHTMDKSND